MPPSSPAPSRNGSSSEPSPPPESATDAGEASSDAASSLALGAVREPQRLHPLTLLLRVGASLPALFIVLLPTLRNPSSEKLISIVLGVLYGIVALPIIVLQYLRFSYRITPKQIVIQKGVLNRQNRSIPIERVQNVQVERNLVARILGVAKVKIITAGSSATEGTLEYVGQADAHRIRSVIRSFQGDRDRAAADDENADDEGETLFSMSLPRVLLSGAFRFSLLYLALIFTALELVDPQTTVQRLLQSQGWVNMLADRMAAHPVVAVLSSVVIAVVLGWISGIVIHLSRYYGFELWLDDDKLRKRHGLFTVTEDTVPLGKVQALILRTNPLMRAFGWYGLEVQTIGTDVDEHGHRVIAPFAQYHDLLQLAQQVRPFALPDEFRSVSMLTIRRMFFRYTAVLGGVFGPLVYFWPADWWTLWGLALPWWSVALLPLILGWAVLHYGNHGYATKEDGLYIRRGVLSHYLWILPTDKFHVFAATASLFQRRLGLKTLFVDTAGAATFAYPEVVDVPEEEADAQLEWLHQRFKMLYRNRIRDVTGDPETRLSRANRPRLPVEHTTKGGERSLQTPADDSA